MIGPERLTEIEARVAIEAAWLFLPPEERCTRGQALAFAVEMTPEFAFSPADQTYTVLRWLLDLLPSVVDKGTITRSGTF